MNCSVHPGLSLPITQEKVLNIQLLLFLMKPFNFNCSGLTYV